MLSNGFSIELHRGAFEHRATPRAGGIVYRLADGSGHVVLPERDWALLLDGFKQAAKPFGRSANWLYFCFPFALVALGLTMSQLPEPVGAVAGIPFLLFLFFGPLAIYVWHSGKVKGLATALEAELRRYPRTAAPPVKPGLIPRWLQVAVLIMVGPELAFQVYGTLFPRAYDRSPWQGLHLDLLGLAGLLLLAAYLLLQWRARWLERAAVAKEVAKAERGGRRAAVVARARGE